MRDGEGSSDDDSDGAGRRRSSGTPATLASSVDADKLALLVADIRSQVHTGTLNSSPRTLDASAPLCTGQQGFVESVGISTPVPGLTGCAANGPCGMIARLSELPQMLLVRCCPQNVVIPELEPLEEAVGSLGKWRSRARDLLAARPTLTQLKEAVEEAAALRVSFTEPPLLTAQALHGEPAAWSSCRYAPVH